MKGSIMNRDRFLTNIRTKIGGLTASQPVEKPVWTVSPQKKVLKDYTPDQLVEVLEEQCQHIHTDFFRTSSNSLEKTLDEVLNHYGAKSVIYSNDERFVSYQLNPYFESSLSTGREIYRWNEKDKETSISFAEKADVGLTFSDMTLAESGTIVLFNKKGQGRSVSLLPRDYIAIVPKSTIVPRMTQATSYVQEMVDNGEDIASCINFITGPSNSADIEMKLVVGVHGPIRAAYIIVDDK
ncbi:L-lactate dehydrogenase complex protein LldG [Gracilibacillus ureilyticus]|uniref:Lactate utilization protein C n=1 Tax=Gracilibacillus ureilyticus TaxID=531814 RepID=A0A1H9LH81_9BACI|nr:lactate utilization protein C [Gracilibacillus ureilyticus]SER10776.1 L-lactate dehydrogenase complex protein LldG [Gracilibacillus ureilyticus]